MTRYDLNLRDYWRIIRRRKWIVIVVPLVFSFVAFAMASLHTPSPLYRATAIVRFERAVSMAGLLQELFILDPEANLETQAALITSFPVMSLAAKKLGLIPQETTPEEIRASPADLDVIHSLPPQVEAIRIERTSLIEVSATSPDPTTAARLANSVAEAFQEHNALTRNRHVLEARRFIESQLDEVGLRLRESEEQLRAFQESHEILLLTDEARATFNRLAAQEGGYERIKRSIRELEAELRLLKDGPIGDRRPGSSPDGAGPAIAKLYASLTELTVERGNLLLSLLPIHPRVKGVDARIANVRRSLIQALSSKLQGLRAKATGVRNAIAGLKAEQAALPEAALKMARMERQVKVNTRIVSLLKERLQEALIKEKEQVQEVSIVRPATIPSAPINPPQVGSKAAVGLLIGLVVSLVLAFVVEALDTSIGAIDEVESLLGSPVLGVIPQLDIKAELSEEKGEAVSLDKDAEDKYSFLISLFAPRSRLAEAFRGLRTNLLFSTLERDFKTIMVTSAAQMEGKTTVSINLANTLAQLGKKTLLVEADLRNPFIHHAFGIPKEPGLTEVLLGSASFDEVTLGFADLMLGKAGMEGLLDSPGMDNLFLLPSGHPPPNPSELLSSQGLGKVLAGARQRYDYIILDSAPILPVPDPAILASQVDAVLTVVRVGHVPRVALRRGKVLLEAAKAQLLGVCLTGVRAELSPDYADMAYYRYRYGARAKTAPAAGTLGSLLGHLPGLRTSALLSLALVALMTGVWAWRAADLNLIPVPAERAPEPVQAPSAPSPERAGGRTAQHTPPPTDPGDSIHPPAPPAPLSPPPGLKPPPRRAGSGPRAPSASSLARPGGQKVQRAPSPSIRPPAPAALLSAPPPHSQAAAFTVQVHAFKSKAKADRAVAAYRGSDVEAFSGQKEKGPWWMVFIGRFATQAEAAALGQKLIRTSPTIKNFTVVRIPAAERVREPVQAPSAPSPAPAGGRTAQPTPPPREPRDSIRPPGPAVLLSAPLRPSGPGAFTVQVHAFQSETRADQMVAAYRAIDLDAFSAEPAVTGKGRWWKVFIGQFGTRAEAAAFGQKLIRTTPTIKNFTVVRIPAAEP